MDVFINSALDYIQGMAAANVKIAAILSMLYLIGFVAKIVRSAVEQIIAETPSQADDLKLKSFKDSQAGKIVYFILDLLFRIKKPEVKKP